MNTENEKYIGESKLLGKPKNKLNFLIKDKAIKPQHLSEELQGTLDNTDKTLKDLQGQIESFQEGHVALRQDLGNSKVLGVSQEGITKNFAEVWKKLEEITGETLCGIDLKVNPPYFFGDEGCDIHIVATTIETNGSFEHIAFYFNDELITEADDVDYLEYDTTISKEGVVKCIAKIMGIEYSRQQEIINYYNFWLGAGNVYTDITDAEHSIYVNDSLRGQYDVTVEEGQHIFIVVDTTLEKGFIRADMNGFEIPFDRTTVDVGNLTYAVYTSVNTYHAGTYNIDING